jgi:hypothetical protein
MGRARFGLIEARDGGGFSEFIDWLIPFRCIFFRFTHFRCLFFKFIHLRCIFFSLHVHFRWIFSSCLFFAGSYSPGFQGHMSTFFCKAFSPSVCHPGCVRGVHFQVSVLQMSILLKTSFRCLFFLRQVPGLYSIFLRTSSKFYSPEDKLQVSILFQTSSRCLSSRLTLLIIGQLPTIFLTQYIP